MEEPKIDRTSKDKSGSEGKLVMVQCSIRGTRLSENMPPTRHKYNLLRIQRHPGAQCNKLLLGLKMLGLFVVGLITIAFVLISPRGCYKLSSVRHGAPYPVVLQKSEEYKQFEVLMGTMEKKILFIETSVEENFCLKLRQSCAVESAARANPGAVVVLLLRAPSVSPNCTTVEELEKLLNVKIIRYTADEIFDGTPLLEWGQEVKSGQVKSPYLKSHLSDALRLAAVHKYSAIYVDLDFIVLRSFDKLFNYTGFLAREEKAGLNGALLGFRGLKSFTTEAMVEFRSTYRGHEWAFNGPLLMKRMLEKWGCRPQDTDCKGLTILDPIAFYPIQWRSAQQLFNDSSVDLAFNLLNDEKVFAVHFWNYLTYDTNSPVHYKNVLNICGRIKCPTTFRLVTKTEKQNFI